MTTTHRASTEVPLANGKGNADAFVNALLTQESGIDPDRFEWYRDHIDMPVMSYPLVDAPGRVQRERRTGAPQIEWMSVRRYFESLGVAQLFDPHEPGCMHKMQVASINALGFVGFQLGEAALISTGYYEPESRWVQENGALRRVDSYYAGSVPASAWAGGAVECLHCLGEAGPWVLATDVNRWNGRFTGKHGIDSLADLRTGEGQYAVLEDLFAFNWNTLLDLVRSGRAQPFKGGQRLPAGATASGLLAAAHLCGAWGVAAFMLDGVPSEDEFGTPMLGYIDLFSGYTLPKYDVSLTDELLTS